MIDTTIKSYGEFIDYDILPEHKTVQFVSIKDKRIFDKVLTKYNGKKLTVDYDKLKSENDSNYMFSLGQINQVTVYLLSNGLYIIDQFIISKINSYYICNLLKTLSL